MKNLCLSNRFIENIVFTFFSLSIFLNHNNSVPLIVKLADYLTFNSYIVVDYRQKIICNNIYMIFTSFNHKIIQVVEMQSINYLAFYSDIFSIVSVAVHTDFVYRRPASCDCQKKYNCDYTKYIEFFHDLQILSK